MKNLTSLKWIFLSSLIFSPIFGCTPPDTDGRLKEFTDMTSELRTTEPVGTPQDGEKVNFSGTYLLRLQSRLSNDLNQSLYFKIDATVSDNVDKVDLKVTGVDHKTFKPVGDSYDLPNNPISEDGTFTFKLENLDFPGPVNSITGAPIQVNVVLTASIKSETTFCGTITEGKLLKPTTFDLPGSTFFAKVVDFNGAISKDDIPNKCPGSSTEQPDDGEENPNPGPDDGDGNTDEAPGAWDEVPKDPKYHCVNGLDITGEWNLEFKTGDLKERLDYTVTFTAAGTDKDKKCFVGTIKNGSDEVGTVSSLSEVNGLLIIDIPELNVSNKYDGVTGDGKVAIRGLVSARTNEALCGKVSAHVKNGDDSTFKEKVAGTWSLYKEGTSGPKLGGNKKLSGCDAFTENATKCGNEYANYGSKDGKEYDIQIKSEIGISKFKVAFYENKLTCLNGEYLRVESDGKKIPVAIISQAKNNGSKVIFNIDSVALPAKGLLKAFGGGWATQELTVEHAALSDSPANFCGSVKVGVYKPLNKDATATFKVMEKWEGDDFDGTCN